MRTRQLSSCAVYSYRMCTQVCLSWLPLTSSWLAKLEHVFNRRFCAMSAYIQAPVSATLVVSCIGNPPRAMVWFGILLIATTIVALLYLGSCRSSAVAFRVWASTGQCLNWSSSRIGRLEQSSAGPLGLGIRRGRPEHGNQCLLMHGDSG